MQEDLQQLQASAAARSAKDFETLLVGLWHFCSQLQLATIRSSADLT